MDPALKTGLEAVVEHLRRDGLDARLGSDCAYLGLGEAALVIPWSQLDCTPEGALHSAVLRVALRLREDGPPLFHDVVTHLGASREEAVVQALLGWRHGVLPPILPLIGGPTLPEVDVFGKENALYCPSWTLYSGPYQISGSQQEAFTAQLRASPPLLTLRELLGREVDRGRMHWLKLFRCRDPECGLDEADCFLDGVPFVPGASRLLEWEWPAVEGQHFFRQFMVLLPEDRAHAELISERLALRQAVRQTIEAMQAHPDADDNEMEAELRRSGIDATLAFKLAEFVPLAFGRVLLAKMRVQVADSYVAIRADGKRSHERKLCEEPIYGEALAVAQSELGSGMARDAFLLIAQRSVEMDAVSNALNQGAEVEGARILPPVITLPKTDAEQPSPRREKEGKRWWQFWR